MEIKRAGSQASTKGSPAWFTGTVRVDPLFQAPDPAHVSGASVTFEPGARTAWHTHPLGQTLVVTAGCGWVQREGGPIEEIRPGDVVWFSPGEKHWHGATPTTAMMHIAVQESLKGKVVDWMEQVSDEQYKNLLPQAPSLCRPLSELPDPTALAGRLRPPSPDANLESSLQTANPYAPVPRSSAAPIAEP